MTSQTMLYFRFVLAVTLLTVIVVTPDWVLATFLSWLAASGVAITGHHAFHPYYDDFVSMFKQGLSEGEVVIPDVREDSSTSNGASNGEPAEGPSGQSNRAA